MSIKNHTIKRTIPLVLALTVLSSALIFNKDINTYASAPTDYNKILKVKLPILSSNSTNMEYVKSTMKGRDIDIYTIVKGDYTPLDVNYFIRDALKGTNFGRVETKLVSAESKALYLITDKDGNTNIELNQVSSSMEPIVLQTSTGKLIAIRFSNKFLKNNDIKLLEGHEIFESGYDEEKDPDIPLNITQLAYMDGLKKKMVILTSEGSIETEKVGEIGNKIENGNTNLGSDIFFVPGGFTNYNKESNSGVPVYKEDSDNKSKDSNSTTTSENKDEVKEDKIIENPGGTGITIEEALRKQKEKADKNSDPDSGSDLDEGLGDYADSGTSRIVRRDPNTGKIISIEYEDESKNKNTGTSGNTGSEVPNKGDKKYFTYINTIAELEEQKRQDPKGYGERITRYLLDRMSSKEIGVLLKEATVNKWSNIEEIKSAYKSALENETNSAMGINDSNYKNTGSSFEKYGLDGDTDTNYINDNYNYSFEDTNNKSPKPTYRFKWGRMDKSNLNGLTSSNDLLIRNVYSYWEVNMVDTDMNKIDTSTITQTPSEQLMQTPITFETFEETPKTLFQLSLLGLGLMGMMVVAFISSRSITKARNREEFQKNLLFKEEKLNLASFDDDSFKLNI